jgi:cobalt-zinc-cadmium efflux system membrane fusion protein
VPQAFTETVGAIGTVTARTGHVATLMAPAPGRIGTVLVTPGQTVRAGQTLVELDRAPFESQLQSAQATLSAATRANDRQQRLAEEGIVPRKDAEQAAADLARARADELSAQRTVDLAVIRAPIGGVVTRLNATLGASVDPAQPLIEVSDPNSLDILLSVTPTNAGRVRPGAKAALSAGQTATGEPIGIGTVVDVAGTVDSTNRSVAVRVEAPTTRRPLRFGETVFGAITVASHPNAIVVPLEALVPEGEEFKVFVVDANGVAHERDVKVGGRSATSAEILEGLHAGERVVTYGAYGVEDSTRIAPATSAGDTSKPPAPESVSKSAPKVPAPSKP